MCIGGKNKGFFAIHGKKEIISAAKHGLNQQQQQQKTAEKYKNAAASGTHGMVRGSIGGTFASIIEHNHTSITHTN